MRIGSQQGKIDAKAEKNKGWKDTQGVNIGI
jgi:hypothetical protein